MTKSDLASLRALISAFSQSACPHKVRLRFAHDDTQIACCAPRRERDPVLVVTNQAPKSASDKCVRESAPSPRKPALDCLPDLALGLRTQISSPTPNKTPYRGLGRAEKITAKGYDSLSRAKPRLPSTTGHAAACRSVLAELTRNSSGNSPQGKTKRFKRESHDS